MATELAKAYVQIVPSAKGISGMLQQELSGEVSSAGDSAGRTLGDCFKGALGGLGKAAGAALAGATTAVGAFTKSAIGAGMSFDAGMSQVSAIAGATGEDFDLLRAKAIEMGSQTQFSATEAAEAMTYMGMAGWETQDMLDGISGIMDLAAASGESLATTSDIVTDALTAFGLTAADSGHFANVLAVAATSANTDVGKMGESFQYVAPLAGTLGFSVEDVSIALGLMGNSSIKASQAGTSLRSALSRLVKPTEDMQGAMTSLGLATVQYSTKIDDKKLQRAQTNVANRTADLEKAQIKYNSSLEKYGENSPQARTAMLNIEKAQNNLAQATYDLESAQQGERKVSDIINNLLVDEAGNMNSLRDVMLSLRSAFQELTEEQKAQYATTLFGQEAQAGMLAIINASEEDFAKLTGAIDDSADAAANMAETMNDNLAGDIMKFKSALETAQIVLSDQLTPSLRDFAQFGTEAIASVTEAFQNGGISGAMDALGTVLSDGLGMIMEMLPQMLDVGMQLLGALGQGILDNLPALTDTALQVILMLAQGIIEALPSLAEGAVQIISTLAIGIGEALPTLIPAAYEAIYTFLAGLTSPESMSNLLGGAVALISGLVEGLAAAMPVIIAYVPEIIANLVTGLIQGIPALLEVGANLILSLGEGLIQGLAAIPEALARVVFAIVDGFKALFGIHSPSTVFAEMGGQLIAGLAEGISAAWTAITEFFSSAASALIDFLSNAWDGIKASAVSAWESIRDALAGVWEGIKGVFEGVGTFFSGVFEAAAQGVTAAWDGVTAFFSSVAEGVQSAFDGVSAFLSDAFNAAWEAVQNAWQAAGEFFDGVWDGIQSGVGAAGEAIGGALSGAWEAIQSAWGAAGDFFAGILDTIIGTFQNVGSTFLEIGGNIVNGIRDGISGAWQALTSFISEKVQGLVGGVKGLLGIHSPSTVFAGIGGNMALGIGEGWGGQFGRVRDAIEKNMTFSAAAVGVQADVSALSGGTAQHGTGRGDTYVTINSPKAVDAVQAAREWRKTTQRMAMGYV